MMIRHSRAVVIITLGIGQIMAWGSSYLLTAVLTQPIVADTGWPQAWVVGALSIGLVVAGLVSPRVGRLIDRHGGRPVMMGGAAIFALGLAIIAAAPTLPLFIAGWVVLGFGMGAGLYDPAFSTLGRLYGQDARSAMTWLTTIGGFATIAWPVTAFLVEHVGWRGACAAYAVADLGLLLPLYWFGLPREKKRLPVAKAVASAAGPVDRDLRRAFLILAVCLTLSALIGGIMSVHLLTLLTAQGLSMPAAVMLGVLMGPVQVGARFIEIAFGRRRHPIWSLLAATVLVAGGVAMLAGAPMVAAAGVIVYSAGNGFRTVARGTVPLALFDRNSFATLMGKLSLPTMLAQAAAPTFGALLLDVSGAGLAIASITALGAGSAVLAAVLLPIALKRGRAA